MTDGFEFEVDPEFFDRTVEELVSRTEFNEDEIRRGLLFMVGRRAGEMLEELQENSSSKLMSELEVAVLHSGQEK